MRDNNNILDEIYKLESKLNKYHESDAGVSFEGLDDANFDLNRYIQINFTKGRKENMQVDHDKINKTLTYFHDIQKSTCEEIVFSIDQNFEKYIGISTKFEGLKDRLTQTQEQFHHFNQLIDEYYTSNTQDLNKLKEVLSTYEQVSKYEIAYRTIEDILQLIEECGKLNESVEKNENAFIMEDLKKASYLVRLAENKYKEVSSRESITADLESKFGIMDCIVKTKESLVESVEKQFKGLLQDLKEEKLDLANRKSVKKIKTCLECFNNLHASQSIQDCIEKIIITPFLDSFVEKMNETKNPQGVSPINQGLLRKVSWETRQSPIKTFFQNILGLLENGPLASLKKFVHHGDAEIEGLNIVMVLWKSVFNLLTAKNFAFIFSVGIADNFNNNYKETINFVNSLAGYLGSPEERGEFWGNEITKRFLAKWSTSTYYQLRFAELIRDFGKFMNEDTLKLYVSEKRSISPLKETKTIKDYIEKCFGSRVFNIHLSSKFLKLAYQMLGMYCSSLEEFYTKYYKNQEYTENKINLLKNIINELHTIDGYCKGGQLLATIDEAFNQDIIAMNCEEMVQIPHEKNQKYVEFFTARLADSIKIFEDEVAKYIYAKCDATLEFVNGIPKKFRMTNRGKPTEPSNFLDNIFLSLGQFFQDYSFQETPRRTIEKTVVNNTYDEYIKRAYKILEIAQKEEETLSRYRNSATAQGGASDYEKIKYQFSLDNQHLAEIVKQLTGLELDHYQEIA